MLPRAGHPRGSATAAGPPGARAAPAGPLPRLDRQRLLPAV